MQICRLFFTAFWNFWRIKRLSTTNHRWVINAQTGPVFLAHPVTTMQQQQLVKNWKKESKGDDGSWIISSYYTEHTMTDDNYLQYIISSRW